MPVKDRLNLTRQTIESLFNNTKYPFELIIISDNSGQETVDYLKSISGKARVTLMRDAKGCAVARNAGMAVAKNSQYYYHSDNDIYFTEGWLGKMIKIMETSKKIGVLGGKGHAYHGAIESRDVGGLGIEICYQQPGFSMLIRRETWLDTGPFLHYPTQELGKEDCKFCTLASEKGWEIARMKNQVIYHCGIRNTFGGNTTGHDEEEKQNFPEGVITE